MPEHMTSSSIPYGQESWWRSMDFDPLDECGDCGVKLINGAQHHCSRLAFIVLGDLHADKAAQPMRLLSTEN